MAQPPMSLDMQGMIATRAVQRLTISQLLHLPHPLVRIQRLALRIGSLLTGC